MHVGAPAVATVALACSLVVGCGGLQRHHVYRPRAPIVAEDQSPLGRERAAAWQLDLREAELRVSPVVLASKLIWVFGPFIAFPTFWEKSVAEAGPLEIGISVKAEAGATVGLDLREVRVVLEDGHSLLPTSAVRWGSDDTEPVGPLTLSGGESWEGFLAYDVPLPSLKPFTLRLGTLEVNGRPLRLPPIPFVAGKSYGGS